MRVHIGNRALIWRGAWLLIAGALRASAQTAPTPSAAEADELFRSGQQLFEQLAPPEIKAQFAFPTREEWDTLTTQFLRALEGDSLEELAAYAPQVQSVLTALRTIPGYEDLADWLEQRLDEIQGAGQVVSPAKTPPAQPPTRPGAPRPPPAPPSVPHFQLWLDRVRTRPAPARAAVLMPQLRAIFVAEGIPPELAWLAEAESSLNPAARSPVGAKGLFQFMPETARAMGLSTGLPDERTDPAKSARAAARYLRQLHGRFANWALVLAAYNAGEGRVARTLAAKQARSFTEIADALPAETRMYVPKVCALIQVRAGIAPHQIAPPKAR